MLKCELLEKPLYLPYSKNGYMVVPFNRSEVLGPYERKQLNLPFRFPVGSFGAVVDALTIHLVRFSPQSNGCRIWGVIENCGHAPKHLTPQMTLCVIKTEITHLMVPDYGLVTLDERKRPMKLHEVQLDDENDHAIEELIRQFPKLTQKGLGQCTDYAVSSVPFCYRLPRQQTPYSLAPKESSLILAELRKLEQLGVVKETDQEPFLIPIFAIPKKTGDIRLVLDFRRFNTCVRQEPFLPVNREHTMAAVRPFVIGSALDLCDAYFQVALAPELHHLFGVTVDNRFFVYQRLPFGYQNSPHEFLRALRPAIVEIQRAVQSQFVAYMDDLLLLSQSRTQHLRDLQTTFAILQQHGWKIRPDKCSFLKTQFHFLGHLVTQLGWNPTAEAMDQITALPQPQTRAAWRSVKGWFQQLVRFVKHGAGVQEALWKAEISGEKKDWLKFLQGLTDHTISIAHALPEQTFGVAVDASLGGWGAVLLQGDRVICCASGVWNEVLQHQISNHLEIEAVVRALNKFKPWVFGSKVVVYSDNSSVASFANPDNHSAFVKRRLDQLQEFCPRLVFLPGYSNVLPDLLSRKQEVFKGPDSPDGDLLMALGLEGMSMEDQLRRAHSGHFSAKKTWQIAQELGLQLDKKTVEKYCRECRICQQFAAICPSVPLGRLADPQYVGELISIDFVGPLPTARSGVKYFLSVIDHLSRWGMATACAKSTSASAKKGILRWLQHRVPPKRVMSDRASYFVSPSFTHWLADLGGELVLTPPYSHHSNGMVERFNRAVVERLRRLCLEYPSKTWSGNLQMAVDCVNEAPHSVTGFSPDYLASGRCLNGRLGGREQLQKDRQLAIQRTNDNRDRYQHVHSRGQPFIPKIGQLVWLFDAVRSERLDQKLHPYWLGPFQVVELLSPHVCGLQRLDSKKRVIAHIDHIQQYI